LNSVLKKTITVSVTVLIGLQLWLVFYLQLFGDEAFYWLEGQYLALSYSELPGWTAWMIRIGTSIFGNHYFAVRFMSYAAFLSIFIALYLINSRLNNKNIRSINSLVLLSMPLLVLIAVMALPDVWLIFFTLWIVYYFLKASQDNNITDWIVLGIILACSINVHVRMWIWLFFAGLSFLICFRSHPKIIKPLLLITLPLTLLGLVPVLIFNYHNDFALFAFQFGQRHPWQFQSQNFSFLFSQLLVITPVVFYLWLKSVFTIKHYFKQTPIVGWILLTAMLHWLFYVVMSLFVDGLRTTVHWLLISYVPVLALSTYLVKNKILLRVAVFSGGLVSLCLLLFLSLNKHTQSNLQARMLDNSMGWDELSEVVIQLQQHHNTEHIIADYFMTASELAFELGHPDSIKVLPHSKNQKHGRQKQLQIMNRLLQDPKDFKYRALLVIEDSGLKLQDKGKYYIQLCDYFNQLEFLESVNIDNSKKQFHLFIVNNDTKQGKSCQFPPLFYIDHKIDDQFIEISGWSIIHNSSIQSLSVVSENDTYPVENTKITNNGIADMFPEIKDSNLPDSAFNIRLPITSIKNNTYKIIVVSSDNNIYLSQNYFLD